VLYRKDRSPIVKPTALSKAQPSLKPTAQPTAMASYHDKIVSILTPQGVGALLMALSMAINFLGYEFARSANLSLFTSTNLGFSHPSAFSIAMACVSPFSFLLLLV
jgi:hypothetical protein